jgi:hypothetical protein
MKVRLSVALALALLAGCVTPHQPKSVSLPSGQQGVAVRCSGTARSWSDCMNAAGSACGGAYEIVSQNGESVGGMAAPVGNSAVFLHAIHREMIVACVANNH